MKIEPRHHIYLGRGHSFKVAPAIEIVKHLPPNYHVEEVLIADDVSCDDISEIKYRRGHVFTKVPEGQIMKIETFHNGFWGSTRINISSATPVSVHSDNLTTDDPNYKSEIEYTTVSPILKYDGRFVELTETLTKWLANFNIDVELLDSISTEVQVDYTRYYPNLGTPVKMSNGGWGYEGSPLTLKDSEILRIIEDIQDEELAMKVYKILTCPPKYDSRCYY